MRLGDYAECTEIAPGIFRARFGANDAWLVQFEGRTWTTRQIAARTGLDVSKAALRIRLAVRDGRPAASIFRPRQTRAEQTGRVKDKEGMRFVERPSCRHRIEKAWRLALCAPWK